MADGPSTQSPLMGGPAALALVMAGVGQGAPVEQATVTLQFTPKNGARIVQKVKVSPNRQYQGLHVEHVWRLLRASTYHFIFSLGYVVPDL